MSHCIHLCESIHINGTTARVLHWTPPLFPLLHTVNSMHKAMSLDPKPRTVSARRMSLVTGPVSPPPLPPPKPIASNAWTNIRLFCHEGARDLEVTLYVYL